MSDQKSLDKLLSENPLGTEFITDEVFPNGEGSGIITLLGDRFRYVGKVVMLEGENGLITLRSYADGFDPKKYEDEEEEDEECEDEDW
jgi:hypothetical protein